MRTDIIQHITLETKRPTSKQKVQAMRGDTNTRIVQATITSDGGVISLDGAVKAVVHGVKADGLGICNDCTINDDRVQFELTTQMLAAVGTLELQIEVAWSDGSCVTTPTFYVDVNNVLRTTSGVESQNEYSALTSMYADVELIRDKVAISEANAKKSEIECDKDLADCYNYYLQCRASAGDAKDAKESAEEAEAYKVICENLVEQAEGYASQAATISEQVVARALTDYPRFDDMEEYCEATYTPTENLPDVIAENLPTASAEKLGAIKVGRNLSITEDGTLNATGGSGGASEAIDVSYTPNIHLTATNVQDALDAIVGAGSENADTYEFITVSTGGNDASVRVIYKKAGELISDHTYKYSDIMFDSTAAHIGDIRFQYISRNFTVKADKEVTLNGKAYAVNSVVASWRYEESVDNLFSTGSPKMFNSVGVSANGAATDNVEYIKVDGTEHHIINAELIDLRKNDRGITYSTAGQAIRARLTELSDSAFTDHANLLATQVKVNNNIKAIEEINDSLDGVSGEIVNLGSSISNTQTMLTAESNRAEQAEQGLDMRVALLEGLDLDERITATAESVDDLATNVDDLKMLGWTVPIEMPIKNYTSNGIFHQRVGRVPTDSLNFYKNEAYENMFNCRMQDIIPHGDMLYLSGFKTQLVSVASMTDKGIRGVSGGKDIYIKDLAYTDATAFQNSLKGKYLYYELATEQTKSVDGNEVALEPTFFCGVDTNEGYKQYNGCHIYVDASGYAYIQSGSVNIARFQAEKLV